MAPAAYDLLCEDRRLRHERWEPPTQLELATELGISERTLLRALGPWRRWVMAQQRRRRPRPADLAQLTLTRT